MIVWPACMSTHVHTVPAEARGGLTRLLGGDIWLKTTQHLPAPQQLLLREDAQALFEVKLVAWEPWRNNEIEDLKVMDPLRPERSLLWLRVPSLPDSLAELLCMTVYHSAHLPLFNFPRSFSSLHNSSNTVPHFPCPTCNFFLKVLRTPHAPDAIGPQSRFLMRMIVWEYDARKPLWDEEVTKHLKVSTQNS